MMRYPCISASMLVCSILLLLTACSSEQGFDDYLHARGMDNLSDDARAREKAAYEERRRLVKYIESSELVDLKKIDADITRMRGDMLVSQFFEQLYQQEINADAIAQYYREHEQDFTVEEHHLAHILLKIPRTASDEERAAQTTTAQEILAKLHTGGDFSVVAQTYSQDTATASQGGELGWVGPGHLNTTLATAAEALPVGEVSGIVTAPYGLHIIKKLSESRERVLPLSRVQPRIVKALRQSVKAAQMARVRSNTRS